MGCVYETIVVDDWMDTLQPEIVSALQKRSTIFIPSRSTVVYLKYPGMGGFEVPFFGNRELLQIEERGGPYRIEKNQDYLVEKGNIPHTKKFKSIYDVPEKMPIIIKASKSIGDRPFMRRFPQIFPSEGKHPEVYEIRCQEFIKAGFE